MNILEFISRLDKFYRMSSDEYWSSDLLIYQGFETAFERLFETFNASHSFEFSVHSFSGFESLDTTFSIRPNANGSWNSKVSAFTFAFKESDESTDQINLTLRQYTDESGHYPAEESPKYNFGAKDNIDSILERVDVIKSHDDRLALINAFREVARFLTVVTPGDFVFMNFGDFIDHLKFVRPAPFGLNIDKFEVNGVDFETSGLVTMLRPHGENPDEYLSVGYLSRTLELVVILDRIHGRRELFQDDGKSSVAEVLYKFVPVQYWRFILPVFEDSRITIPYETGDDLFMSEFHKFIFNEIFHDKLGLTRLVWEEQDEQ